MKPFTLQDGFLAIEAELQRRREQTDSVRGKDTPFRVAYSFRGQSWHYVYFTSLEDARNAEAPTRCSYNIMGSAILEQPSSRRIEIRGPRGGWRKYVK